VATASIKYVYGVLAANSTLPEGTGIGGAALELVSSDGLAALVSELPDGSLRRAREAMSTHTEVLSAAHAVATVLPMRFGMVMEDDAEIRRRLLDPHRESLAAQLEEFAGTTELKLRATYEEDQLFREVVREDQDVARLSASLRGQPEDATYYGRIQLGELIAAAIARKREHDAGEMLDALAPLAIAVDVGAPAHERVVLNASFLVEQARLEAFDSAVDKIGGAQARRMRLKYVGPLPPHSFVDFGQER
jgi:Gas vesicle synthesis protein GvpL/GvpF